LGGGDASGNETFGGRTGPLLGKSVKRGGKEREKHLVVWGPLRRGRFAWGKDSGESPTPEDETKQGGKPDKGAKIIGEEKSLDAKDNLGDL